MLRSLILPTVHVDSVLNIARYLLIDSGGRGRMAQSNYSFIKLHSPPARNISIGLIKKSQQAAG